MRWKMTGLMQIFIVSTWHLYVTDGTHQRKGNTLQQGHQNILFFSFGPSSSAWEWMEENCFVSNNQQVFLRFSPKKDPTFELGKKGGLFFLKIPLGWKQLCSQSHTRSFPKRDCRWTIWPPKSLKGGRCRGLSAKSPRSLGAYTFAHHADHPGSTLALLDGCLPTSEFSWNLFEEVNPNFDSFAQRSGVPLHVIQGPNPK